MQKPDIKLIGYTQRALDFIAENKKATIDEVALHLNLGLNHTRDVLFRARERGLVRKIPVTFVLTPTGRKSVTQNGAAELGSSEEDLTRTN